MEKEHIVKARLRQGTKSMDLTIPADLIKEYDISYGDLFKISVETNNDGIKLIYSRIYKK